MSSQPWASLLHLQPADFRFPDKVNSDLLRAVDRLFTVVGQRGRVLSDWRSFDRQNPNTQHHISDFESRAVDLEFPGADALAVWSALRAARLFTGVGVYINELGATSFHVDNRLSRSVDNPATWGGVITRPYDAASDAHVKRIEYVAAGVVLDMIKKKVVLAGSGLLLTGLLLFAWKWIRGNSRDK